MRTPIHSIFIDFSHSTEVKLLRDLIMERGDIGNSVEEDHFLTQIIIQLESSIELLESMEM
ncbi:hypothetical protein CSW98_14040 [Vibrio sp. HA2012]|uniref:hypothetical protein n=1 Tax=Vibrio sp. HA2012 TaxID=1971595 RepID=UPI000C2C2705|nr:hypothetical protein [Vibrio sp. HA2012]PJC85693.1 hypothetical protein CSW98_14040 [Vibrio sp. HA2012]